MVTFPNRSRNTRHSTRIVGVDDGAFQATRKIAQRVLLAAVLLKDVEIEDVALGRIQVDGTDANRVLESVLRKLRFDGVMLSGISFGGFNVVNINALSRAIRRPVIALTGDKPDNEGVCRALRGHFRDWRERWRIIRASGPTYTFKPMRDEPSLYFEVQGASPGLAKKWIATTARVSRLPEPIRIARIMAKGLGDLTYLNVP